LNLLWVVSLPAGNIRRAEHFIGFLRRFVAYLAERMNAPAVVSEGPAAFLAGVQQAVAVDAKTLRYDRAPGAGTAWVVNMHDL
jgi:hypothetical protein